MQLFISNNNFVNVVGVDKDAEIFEVEDIDPQCDNGTKKFLRFGGSVIWEEHPPTCKKCKINKNTFPCTAKCYDFKALHGKGAKKTVSDHQSKSRSRRELVQHELYKINEMKKDGREYTSWLYKSLFESEDNTERMDFDISMVKN